jgi:hypothetical protein
MANTELASKHDWGREFRPALQEIRRKFKYNHRHDAASINFMLKELAAADAVRQLSDAPEPTAGTANAVTNSMNLLTQMLQQANQQNEDYEESAFAAQSDSDSSGDQKSCRRSTG